MTSSSKIRFASARVAVMCGTSLMLWVHEGKAIERPKISDAATASNARTEQGDLRSHGRGGPQDYSEVVQGYRKAAEQGDAKSQFDLASMYYHGKGVQQDYAEAIRWCRKSADQGYLKAQVNLAGMLHDGKGASPDYAGAIRLYRKAADQGDAKAEYALGYMYSKGQGAPQDYAGAIRLFRKAADQGNADAQYALGYMYFKGEGVPQDYAEARGWYRKAADQGDAMAESALHSFGMESSTATRMHYLVILMLFLTGLWFSLDFLLPGRKLQNPRQLALTLLGIFFLANAGLSLYAITHHDMRYSPHRHAYHVVRGLSVGIAILIIVTAVLPAKKKTNETAA